MQMIDKTHEKESNLPRIQDLDPLHSQSRYSQENQIYNSNLKYFRPLPLRENRWRCVLI